MQRIDVAAEVRVKSGKGAARQLRREGKVPAVLYGAGASTLLTLDPKQIARVLQHGGHGENVLIGLTLTNSQDRPTRTAILRDFQMDPITGRLLHADIFEIALDKPIRLKVPVQLIGESPVGVKDGGVLQHQLREVEVEGLPDAIPDRIPVDASSLMIGQAIHAKDLVISPNVKIVSAPHAQILSVVAPISEAKLEQLLTTTPATEAKEPEVLHGKKPEEAAETAEAAAPKAEKGEPAKKATTKPEGKIEDKAKKPEEKAKKDEPKRQEKKSSA